MNIWPAPWRAPHRMSFTLSELLCSQKTAYQQHISELARVLLDSRCLAHEFFGKDLIIFGIFAAKMFKISLRALFNKGLLCHFGFSSYLQDNIFSAAGTLFTSGASIPSFGSIRSQTRDVVSNDGTPTAMGLHQHRGIPSGTKNVMTKGQDRSTTPVCRYETPEKEIARGGLVRFQPCILNSDAGATRSSAASLRMLS